MSITSIMQDYFDEKYPDGVVQFFPCEPILIDSGSSDNPPVFYTAYDKENFFDNDECDR